MSLVKCKYCQHIISAHCYRCPHCQNIVGNEPEQQHTAHYNRGSNPYNSLGWAAVAFLICPLFGIISIIYYFKSEMAWNHDDEMTAARHGRNARNWGKVPLYIILALFALSMIIALFN